MGFKNTLLPEQVDFKDFTYPSTPNFFLLAPADGLLPLATDPASPVFDVEVGALESAWKKMMSDKGIRQRSFSAEKRRYHYLCKTLIFRFPDYLIAQFFPLENGQSTLLLYSYSVYGKLDFGANKTRVFKYLIALKKTLDKQVG